MALETNASHESDRGPWLVPRPRGHGRLAFTGGGETKTCLPLRNKPPTHWQRESPQPPILQLVISCRTSRCVSYSHTFCMCQAKSWFVLPQIGKIPHSTCSLGKSEVLMIA